jgi:hypothetical protein
MSNASVGANHLLGKGKLWFNRRDAAGVVTGERYLGNCDQFEITPTDDIVEIRDSATKDGGLIDQALRQRTLEATIQMREFTKENIALALMGENAVLTQGAGAVSNEIVAIKKRDRQYQLGGYTTINRKLDSGTPAVVTGPSASPTYTVNTDYIINYDQGTIYIPATSTIPEDGNIEVDYTKLAITTLDVAYLGTASFIEGILKFEADPARGPKWDMFVWRLQINAQSALALIGEEYASTQLRGKVLGDPTNYPTNPYGRMILRT